jgi:hypothetical protein
MNFRREQGGGPLQLVAGQTYSAAIRAFISSRRERKEDSLAEVARNDLEVVLGRVSGAHVPLLPAGFPAVHLLRVDQIARVCMDAVVCAASLAAVLAGMGRGGGGLPASQKRSGVFCVLRNTCGRRFISFDASVSSRHRARSERVLGKRDCIVDHHFRCFALRLAGLGGHRARNNGRCAGRPRRCANPELCRHAGFAFARERHLSACLECDFACARSDCSDFDFEFNFHRGFENIASTGNAKEISRLAHFRLSLGTIAAFPGERA